MFNFLLIPIIISTSTSNEDETIVVADPPIDPPTDANPVPATVESVTNKLASFSVGPREEDDNDDDEKEEESGQSASVK